jgi:4-hydroxybenzoate polyprenyltransferase
MNVIPGSNRDQADPEAVRSPGEVPVNGPSDLDRLVSARPLAAEGTVPGSSEAESLLTPLFVDLDGSLISTDLLWESLFALLKRRPAAIVLVPFWALRGKTVLKDRISRAICLAPESMPYDQAVIGLIRERQRAGSPVVLATASPEAWARPIAEHLGGFDGVLATSPVLNLKGIRKLEAITRLCGERGWPRFDYVGDTHADMAIWKTSSTAYVVGAGSRLARRVGGLEPAVSVRNLGAPGRPLRAAFKALRPHQWAKNVLIFVPLITGHKIFEAAELIAASLAFVAFSLCASAIYLVNDLADLADDREHTEKRRRPFASGRLPLSWGPPMIAALLLTSFAIAGLALPLPFLAVLSLYLGLTTLYSLVIKSRLMVDVLTLASLYSLRIFAGGVATKIVISEWLIGFSMFFFLSLAFAKRYIELDRAIQAGKTEKIKGRGYRPGDLSLVESFGATTGYLSALVLALYIRSDEVRHLYRRPEWLWLIVLTIVYWISRIWFLAKRRELPGDPVVFALKDRHSLVIGVVSLTVLAIAANWP